MQDPKQVAMQAQEAFWKTVAANYPQATTGDLDAELSVAFDRMCERVVATWMEENAVQHNGAHTDIVRPEWLRAMGFDDVSWAHDACACMDLTLNKQDKDAPESIRVWVEHTNRLMREDLRCPRYRVQVAFEADDIMAGLNMLPGVEDDAAARAQVERVQTAYAAKGKEGLREQVALESKWSFEKFVGSKREANSAEKNGMGIEEYGELERVWLYANAYWIGEQANGEYFLVLERDSWLERDLALLERRLFDFAVLSGNLPDQDLPKSMQSKKVCICGEIRPCAHTDKHMNGEWHYSETFCRFLRYDAEKDIYEESPRWLDGSRGKDSHEIFFPRLEPSTMRTLEAFFLGEVN